MGDELEPVEGGSAATGLSSHFKQIYKLYVIQPELAQLLLYMEKSFARRSRDKRNNVFFFFKMLT